MALLIVRTGGHFVCKIFDLFTPFSVALIYLMYRSFAHISIHKPNTSRPANSERYLFCCLVYCSLSNGLWSLPGFDEIVFRYLICKWKRPDCENIRDYMYDINKRLNKCGGTASSRDIVSILPLEIMKEDKAFFEYVLNSNNK